MSYHGLLKGQNAWIQAAFIEGFEGFFVWQEDFEAQLDENSGIVAAKRENDRLKRLADKKKLEDENKEIKAKLVRLGSSSSTCITKQQWQARK